MARTRSRRDVAQTSTARVDLVAEGFVTVKEAMTYLSVSRASLYRLMNSGHLEWSHFGGSRRIPRQALFNFAAYRIEGGWKNLPSV